MFNTTCVVNATSTAAHVFASVWVESLEFRVAVFIMVLQCSFMLWAAAVVREIMKTSTTVLCKLLVYDCAASVAPGSRTLGSYGQASVPCTRHKTDGGPPPVPHPEDVQSGS